MVIEDTFFHDLRNELQLLKLHLEKLAIENEITIRINHIVDSIVSKCASVTAKEKPAESLVNVNAAIETMTTFFPDIKFEKAFNEEIEILANKSRFQDVLLNLIKNAKEAGATKIKIETKFKSLIISDNGECTQDTVDKLNNANTFTTKKEGKGLGSKSVRDFCEKNECRLSYHLVPNIDQGRKNSTLGVRIKFS